jgi:HK97 family phage portal protein
VAFWQVVIASMMLWGNAYIEIIRSGSTVVALQFLYPARITLRRLANGTYEYVHRDLSARESARERVIPESRMMHITAFSTDGVMGLSPIAFGVNVFGTSIETDRASAQTFKNALRSPGLLRMDMTLSPEQREQLRAHVKTVSDSGGIMVMEKGAGFDRLGFDPVSAELLASRAWNVEEMCRWYGVDPSMIGHGGKDSNWGTGLEEKMTWFVTLTLRTWCVQIEQAVRKSLLTPAERNKYFAEFALEGLLRGNSTARATYYATMEQNGNMTRDEVRAKENLPPMGGNAAVLTVQSNMIPLDKLGENLNPPPGPSPTDETIANLRNEVRAISVSLDKPHIPPVINVDARTTVNPAAAPSVTVNVPERPSPDVNVDARTTINPAPAPDVVVNNAAPEIKTPDVKVEVAAPVVNYAPPDIAVNIAAEGGDKVTTYTRDPKTNEILSSTTKRK